MALKTSITGMMRKKRLIINPLQTLGIIALAMIPLQASAEDSWLSKLSDHSSLWWWLIGIIIVLVIACILVYVYIFKDPEEKEEEEVLTDKHGHGHVASDTSGDHHGAGGESDDHKKEHHHKETPYLVKKGAQTLMWAVIIWTFWFFLWHKGCGSDRLHEKPKNVHNAANPYVEYVKLYPGIESKPYYVNESLRSTILGPQFIDLHVTFPDGPDTVYKNLSEKHRLPKGTIPKVRGTALTWKCKDSATIRITWY